MPRYQRAYDLTIILAAGLLLLPVWVALWVAIPLAIRLWDGGPVFYTQARLGRGGRPFRIIKFRTMVRDAEAGVGPVWATVNDPRVTRVGRLLRATELDELPQVVNVLRGEMSLVGPRPERPELAARFEAEIPGFGERLAVRPGIAGLAHVYGDSHTPPQTPAALRPALPGADGSRAGHADHPAVAVGGGPAGTGAPVGPAPPRRSAPERGPRANPPEAMTSQWSPDAVRARRAVERAERAALLGREPLALWFTGLSGAGKTTLANALARRLHDCGYHTYVLDGDNLRRGLNRDLDFSEAARRENVRRVAEVASLMHDAGVMTLVACISPFQAERDFARSLLPAGRFVEVFVDTALELCERRDAKGLYRRARAGEITDFTGIDSPFERPTRPELTIDTGDRSPDACVEVMMNYLHGRGLLPALRRGYPRR